MQPEAPYANSGDVDRIAQVTDIGPTDLIGTWRVLSFELRSDDGGTNYPFGPDPQGYLMYTPDGFMSWAVMRADRARFSTDDLLAGTIEEKIAAAETYIAYCGRYSAHDN